MALARALVLLAAALTGAEAAAGGSGLSTNPIRRVVTMLQGMQTKITEEAKKDEALFEKFMCYCKTGGGDLKSSIDAAETKLPQVTSSLDEASATKTQLEEDVKRHKQDRAEAKEVLAKQLAIREKEAAEYAKESSDAETNIAAMAKAITALEKGASGFLQTSAASVLRRLTIDMDMSSVDRDMLTSFLSQGQGYAPQSTSITGILKQMKGTMDKSLADMTKEEEAAKAAFAALSAAKEKEMAASLKAIEDKTQRIAELGVEIATLKEDLEDTSKSLAEDQGFLANLEKSCTTKEKEWEAVKKTRADELVALAETIKILNDDDALELFKKTLPSASLLQTVETDKHLRRKALQALGAVRSRSATKDARLDLLALALHGQKVSFEKILGMMDDMLALLAKEQTDDDEKKAYCESKLDKTEDDFKVLSLAITDLEKAIKDAESMSETLVEEIEALEKGVQHLDAKVAEATENRKAENAEYKATVAADTAAKELLKLATNRLNQFYNPKLYKPPAKEERSAVDAVADNFAGSAAVFVQIAKHHLARSAREAPPPPPETFGPYMKKGQESTGVMAMMDLLVADLDKEMQELSVEEKDAQAEYEGLMADSAAKRASDLKSIDEKESAKADLETELEKLAMKKQSTLKEAMTTSEVIKDLHLECDWLLKNFAVRKTARAGEIESVKNAKDVLSGADYSLLQTSRVH
mmetsp:Transcript_64485/g.199953  ORF Transcript_64485/g.199953 Transcript_64485/m.199953 type:complete len:700 (-) Transcript_64485:84-2183(-)